MLDVTQEVVEALPGEGVIGRVSVVFDLVLKDELTRSTIVH